MTEEHKPVPHPAEQPMAKKAKPKVTHRMPGQPPKLGVKATPKPAPRASMIPSVVFKSEVSPGKGRIAGAVAATVGAISLIGYGIAGVAGRMLRRGR